MTFAFDYQMNLTVGQDEVDESRGVVAVMPSVFPAGYLPAVPVGAETNDFLDGELKGESGRVDEAEWIARMTLATEAPMGLSRLLGGTVRLCHAVSLDHRRSARIANRHSVRSHPGPMTTIGGSPYSEDATRLGRYIQKRPLKDSATVADHLPEFGRRVLERMEGRFRRRVVDPCLIVDDE